MSDLIVLAFDDEQGAESALEEVGRLQRREVVEIDDAATVIRLPDGRVKVHQAVGLVGHGALGGAFWGMLIGLLFLMPWLGLAVGAVAGAIGGRLSDVGIDDSFIEEVGNSVAPGHSALFLLVRAWRDERAIESLSPLAPRVLRTSLTHEDEAKLREAFGADAP